MQFTLNLHSGVPVYRQIIDQVKYYVAGGTLHPGEQLPSIRELSEALTVNPTTVVIASAELNLDAGDYVEVLVNCNFTSGSLSVSPASASAHFLG